MGIMDDIGGWGDRLKRLYDVSKNLKNIELTEAIADLRIALSDWKLKFSDLQEENLKLQAKVNELEQQLSSTDELTFRDGAYYRTNPIEGKPNGPFCPNCWKSHSRAFPLTKHPPNIVRAFGIHFVCPECKTDF